MVGTAIIQRRGSTDVWNIGTVGVLPAKRRRGIACKVLEAVLDLIRNRDGKKMILSMIDGNLPAYKLNETLGFEHYSSNIEFHITQEKASLEPAIPEGYALSPIDWFDWRPRYDLEKRISPENLLRYEPVEVGRFRQPVMMRLLWPLIMFTEGTREENFVIRFGAEGQIVAQGGHSTPTRGRGLNNIWGYLDPAHPELAAYLVEYLLYRVIKLCPGHRVYFSVPRWIEAVVSASKGADFKRRLEYCCMGVEL